MEIYNKCRVFQITGLSHRQKLSEHIYNSPLDLWKDPSHLSLSRRFSFLRCLRFTWILLHYVSSAITMKCETKLLQNLQEVQILKIRRPWPRYLYLTNSWTICQLDWIVNIELSLRYSLTHSLIDSQYSFIYTLYLYIFMCII